MSNLYFAANISNRYKDITEGASPIIDNWPLMGSPLPVLSIATFYLLFVLQLGPRWMQHRKPFDLQWLLIAYNAAQVLCSLALCIQPLFLGGVGFMFSISCNDAPVVDTDLQLTIWKGTWWYLVLKLVELLDTVFFVLRKKQNQVSFLHVYHHTIMAVFTWGYLKYIPGIQGAFLGVLNTYVHVIMYSYYLLAALGPRYQRFLWWKKYLTTLQLAQFGIMLVYLLLIISFQCTVPRSLSFFFIGNVAIFLVLFCNFYRKAYSSSSSSSGKQLQTGGKVEKKQQ